MILPLTPYDLRQVAAALEPIETNEAIVQNPLVGRIEVRRPGSPDVIGYFQSAEFPAGDDWYGFVPAMAPLEEPE